MSTEEIMQCLEDLQLPEGTKRRCRELAEAGQYEAVWQALRCTRMRFLEEMHTAQDRLDRLDQLIYLMKKKSDGGERP